MKSPAGRAPKSFSASSSRRRRPAPAVQVRKDSHWVRWPPKNSPNQTVEPILQGRKREDCPSTRKRLKRYRPGGITTLRAISKGSSRRSNSGAQLASRCSPERVETLNGARKTRQLSVVPSRRSTRLGKHSKKNWRTQENGPSSRGRG